MKKERYFLQNFKIKKALNPLEIKVLELSIIAY